MSPYAFHQFWLHAEDSMVGELPADLLVPPAGRDRAAAGRARAAARRPRLAQRALAADVTALVHGDDELRAAEQAGQALFGRGDLAALPEATLAAALAEAPHARVESGRHPAERRRRPGRHRPGRQQEPGPAHRRGGRCVREQRAGDRADDPLPAARCCTDAWWCVRKGKRSVAGRGASEAERRGLAPRAARHGPAPALGVATPRQRI